MACWDGNHHPHATGRGFDTSFRYLNAANDYYNETQWWKVWSNWSSRNVEHKQTAASDKNGTRYEEALFRERLLDIIDPSKPFFLYYAAHIVHKLYQVPKEYLDMFKFIDNDLRRVYRSCNGQVFGWWCWRCAHGYALKERGLWDDLLFLTKQVVIMEVRSLLMQVPTTIHSKEANTQTGRVVYG